MSELPRPLRGIIPPLATPLIDYDTLDQPGLERLVEHVLSGGVSGLFLLGTSGEGPSLSYRLREELVRRVCRQAAGRTPILVGVTDTSLAESLRMAALAAEAGAAAVVLAAPPYFPIAQSDLERYIRRIAGESPLPLLLYNMPSHTKLVYEFETLRRLFDLPKIVGLKDSSGDLAYFHGVAELLAGRSDVALLIGPEEHLADALRMGAQGGVCGGANLEPRLYVDLWEAMQRKENGKDDPTVERLQSRIRQIVAALYTFDSGSAGVVKGLKCALNLAGICNDCVAPPLHALHGSARAQIRHALDRLGIAASPSSLSAAAAQDRLADRI